MEHGQRITPQEPVGRLFDGSGEKATHPEDEPAGRVASGRLMAPRYGAPVLLFPGSTVMNSIPPVAKYKVLAIDIDNAYADALHLG